VLRLPDIRYVKLVRISMHQGKRVAWRRQRGQNEAVQQKRWTRLWRFYDAGAKITRDRPMAAVDSADSGEDGARSPYLESSLRTMDGVTCSHFTG
jgi:hypothetical protein